MAAFTLMQQAQVAMRTAMLANSTLTGLLADATAILDHVPSGQDMPYIVIGDGSETPHSTMGTRMLEASMDVKIFSDSKGWETCDSIAKQVMITLDRQALTLSENTFVSCEFQLSTRFRDEHGVREHALEFLIRGQE